jgi:hypothetical protein
MGAAAIKSELQAGRPPGIGEAILIELIGMLPSGDVGAEAQWLLSLLRSAFEENLDIAVKVVASAAKVYLEVASSLSWRLRL